MSAPPPPSPARTPMPSWGPWIMAAVLLAAAAAVFYVIYLAVPGPANTHYNALLTIGIVALVFGLAAYLAQSFSRRPIVQQALGWGFLAMGYTTLILTLVAVPNPTISAVDRLIGLVVVAVFLAFTVIGIYWRTRVHATQAGRIAERQEWAGRPAPSAFNYTTAQPPAVGPPPVPANVPPTPPAAPPPAGGR